MNAVTLYSTGCPKCTVLKRKLSENNIEYVESNDVDKMSELGIQSVPMLEVGGELLDFSEAIGWVNAVNITNNENGCEVCKLN